MASAVPGRDAPDLASLTAAGDDARGEVGERPATRDDAPAPARSPASTSPVSTSPASISPATASPVSPSSASAPSAEFAGQLDAVAGAVEATLDDLLASAPGPGETARPARLVAAMRHAVLGGGKRLRPFLLAGAAWLAAGRTPDPGPPLVPHEGAILAGAAVELLHGYSLVHDDLPAMDNDDLRRGRPTVHRAYDEATAILAGDALLTLAFDALAREAVDADPAVRVALVTALARAGGLGGMVGGQMLDLAAEGRFGDAGPAADAAGRLDAVRRLQAMKTGALILGSVEMGAILARLDEPARARLRAYGRAVGAAFQLADDLLDVEGAADAVGKALRKDEAAGKATLPGLMGVEAARAQLASLVDDALEALSGFGVEADPLRDAARFTAARTV